MRTINTVLALSMLAVLGAGCELETSADPNISAEPSTGKSEKTAKGEKTIKACTTWCTRSPAPARPW